jgi:hypothetical protein
MEMLSLDRITVPFYSNFQKTTGCVKKARLDGQIKCPSEYSIVKGMTLCKLQNQTGIAHFDSALQR